ncbi:MAG: twin-arginine translocation pathway signal, partial [Rudanella sp.]|nr:twin-arginine translocation pathway signal [Rudanella sp.]
MNRRDFLQKSSLTTAGSLLIPNFLKAYELNRMGLPANSQKIVVVVQLSGGNDGLNTIVPFQNDIYYRERPTIAIRPSTVLKLTDELGLNPALEPLRALYDDGQMTLINNVGYPNPDRSHFRSMDIWHTASDSNQYLSTGWVGRYLDAQCAGKPANRKGVAYRALEVDDTLSLSMKGAEINGLAVLDPKKLFNQTRGE